MRRILAFIDWRFIFAIAFLILVVSLVQNAMAAAEERDRAVAQSVADRKAADAERAHASVERERLLDGQRDLEGKYDRLIIWLNGQGIAVPEAVLTGRPTGRENDNDDDDNDDDDSDSTEGSGKQSPPKSGPTAAPPKAQPQRTGRPSGSDRGSDRRDDQGRRGSDKADRPDPKPEKPQRPAKH